ncbi:MAG TPA: thiamine pyrophosphate-binding protein, partial [Thermodesulfobacteriota bacterium]|nr:thiamine pyrophosphate-binding protein [Thermodesulfobacteriota bacterium]
LLDMLVAQGVRYIFGNPGTTELPLMDAIQDYPQLRYVLGLQEAACVAMADGYARASGQAGFVNLHVTGGIVNGLSILYDAFRGGTPLVVTAGQSDTRMHLEEPLLFSDMVTLCRQYTKWSAEVRHGRDVFTAIRRAFRTAMTPPTGPVFLSLPMNVLDEAAEHDQAPVSPLYTRLQPDPEGLEKAVELLTHTQNPLMLVGDRIAQSAAVSEAVKMAERLGATVMALSFSEVNFPTNHPLFSGVLDPDSSRASELLARHDLILAVGCSMFQQFVYSPLPVDQKTPIIHLDVNSWEIEKNIPVTVGVWGDIKTGLRLLEEKLSNREGGNAFPQKQNMISEKGILKAQARSVLLEKAQKHWDQKPIDPIRLFWELKEALPEGAIVASEAITSTVPLFRVMDFIEPGSFFSLRGGALGWGIGGALGIKLARPDRPVVAVVGDGSALYSIQGLWTAVQYNLPVTYIICNNRSYRILKHYMANYYLPNQGLKNRRSAYTGMNFSDHPLDCAALARGFGLRGYSVEDPGDLKPVLTKALSLNKPALIDVHIQSGNF